MHQKILNAFGLNRLQDRLTVGKIDFTEQKNYFVKRFDIWVNLIYNINVSYF